MVGKKWNTQILVNLPATYVPGSTRGKEKALALEHLHPPDVGAGSGPPCGTGIIRKGTDELLV